MPLLSGYPDLVGKKLGALPVALDNSYAIIHSMSKKVLIGLSWPYANGRLHIGSIASSLPADALARFHRMRGNDVAFVTGSDCYGTPILVAAKAEGITPAQLSDKYHECHLRDFLSLGFTFDNYTKTTSTHHNEFVQNFHAEMYDGAGKSGDAAPIYAQAANQLYCGKCEKYLPDRYVEGTCPHCEKEAKGDSCDHCGKMLEPEELVSPRCKLCSATPVSRLTSQLYIRLSALQQTLQDYYNDKKDAWANNAIGLTGRYLNEGLHDRAITRNIEWGIPLPHNAKKIFGFSDKEMSEKKIYIWAENVLGYPSACKEFCDKTGRRWQDFLLNGTPTEKIHYYVHGKDNIPFHALILPGLLLSNPRHDYHLPDMIVSSEYVKIAQDKISKSKGNLITAHEMVEKYPVDTIRYYFLKHVNDRKDTNFTIEEFTNTINADLVNGFGNLVNRTLSFIKTKLDGKTVPPPLDPVIEQKIQNTFDEAGALIEAGRVNRALAVITDLVNFGNKYFDTAAPWRTIKTDADVCVTSLFGVTTIIANLARLLYPFIPNACDKLATMLHIQPNTWQVHTFINKIEINEIEILFKPLLDYKAV